MATIDEETAAKILNQVEFYFSDSNLPRDDFLMKKVSQSRDGMVNLALVCSFSRIRGFLGVGKIKQDDVPDDVLKSVAKILRNSKFLKVSNDGRKVGRVKKLSKVEEVIEQVDIRTIAASPFPYDVTMENVESFFATFGKVNSVRLPRHSADKRIFCGSALIEFSTDADAEHILKQSLIYAGATLELKPKKEFDSERAKSSEQIGKDGCFLVHSNCRNDTNGTSSYPKGLLIAFTSRRRSVGKPIKSNSCNIESITNKEGVCKEQEEVVSNGDFKQIENTSDDTVEALAKNHGKEKCKGIEESGQMISEEMVNISAQQQDSIFHDKDQSSEGICHESNEKATGKEKCTAVVREGKNVLLREDLKNVFQRFGVVKHIDYQEGTYSGYIHFEKPEGAIKARAAAEFIEAGLIVKNFIISFEAPNAKAEEEYWSKHRCNEEVCPESSVDKKRRKYKYSDKGERNFEDRKSHSEEDDSPTNQPTKSQKDTNVLEFAKDGLASKN